MKSRNHSPTAPAGLLLLALLAAGCARHAPHVQVADEAFDALIAEPEFAADGPKVLFDEAHRNFHTAGGRYAPFARLLTNDGFRITANTAPLAAETLAGHDLLVIVNADAAPGGRDAFAPAEVAAVAAWVEAGGALLLIADHRPFGAAAASLAAAFDVTLLDAHLKDEQNSEPSLPGPYFLLFTRDNGLIGDHPITAGRSPVERIDRVVTFGGQALRAPPTARRLLLLSPTAIVVQDPQNAAAGEEPAGDAVHAAALRVGRGRVVVLGEAAVFTAQVITGETAQQMGLTELRIGMSRADTDNRQLALNTVRWLAGRLD
jgi:hypothetical protein